MGRLKESLIIAEEAQFNAMEHDFGSREVLRKVPQVSRDEWVSYGMANQQDWSEFTKEFEAWLDDYEASFGNREDLS
jgi:hypothetical protein